MPVPRVTVYANQATDLICPGMPAPTRLTGASLCDIAHTLIWRPPGPIRLLRMALAAYAHRYVRYKTDASKGPPPSQSCAVTPSEIA
jgi:hypothetical protein